MIPKKIHYCWFGGKPKTELAKKCIATWRKCCPDYEIIEWNEQNFDLDMNKYAKEAYDNKKWAFITDFARLYLIYTYGGIYLDTDVELVQSLDDFLECPAFSGYEDIDRIPTAVMGCEKGNKWVNYLLSYYENKHFVKYDGTLDLTTNVITITKMTSQKYNILLNGSKINMEGEFVIFPKNYFCPKKPGERSVVIDDCTYAIHHFDGSWMDGDYKVNQFKMRHYKLLKSIRTIIVQLIGEKSFEKLRNRKRV